MTDYAYLNARICSMRAELLSRSEIEEMLHLENSQMVAERLMKGPYQHEIATCMRGRHNLTAIEDAFDMHLAACFEKILGLISQEDAEWIYLLTEAWDIQCLKIILRGILTETPAQEILELIGPGARLSKSDLKELAESADIKTVTDLLVTWSVSYGTVLRSALPTFRADQNLHHLEFALDQHRFEKGKESYQKNSVAADLLLKEADLKNIISCLLHIDDEIPELLPCSPKNEGIIRSLKKATGIDKAIEILANSSFRSILDKALPFLMQAKRFAMFERLLYSELLRQSAAIALRDPLSIAVPCHFLRCKYNEIMNLRLIAHGLDGGMPQSAIITGLIFAN